MQRRQRLKKCHCEPPIETFGGKLRETERGNLINKKMTIYFMRLLLPRLQISGTGSGRNDSNKRTAMTM
jgi:hypothetical protein